MSDEFNTDNQPETTNDPMPETPIQESQPESPAQEPQQPEQAGSQSFYHYTYEKDKQGGQAQNTYEYGQTQSGQNNFGQAPQEPGKKNKQKKERKPASTGKKFAICIALALVFGIIASVTYQAGNAIGGKLFGTQDSSTSAAVAEPESTGTESDTAAADTEAQTQTTEAATEGRTTISGGADVTAVAKKVMPSIVAITNKGVQEVQSMFFGTTQQQETESDGSGFIIAQTDTELLIATNNHVVADAQTLSVCFTVDSDSTVDEDNADEAIVSAQVKGTDAEHDLAVVAVNLSDISENVMKNIQVADLGDSDKIEVGNQVIAIGNALGYGQSVTVGYISALNREITIDDMSCQMIQTDAAINFGNSGGALLDANGNVIGINSAKAADTGVEGMGYAIPINTAKPILDDLMNRTTRTKAADGERGYLGLVPTDVSEEARQIYNLPAGAFVYEVVAGSAAETAGIKKGDIITKLDGISITSKSDLLSRMEYYKVGETIDVVVKTANGGEYSEHTVSVTLGEKVETDSTTTESETQSQSESSQNDQSESNGQSDGYYGEQYPQDQMPYGDNGGQSQDDYYNSLEEFFNQFNQ